MEQIYKSGFAEHLISLKQAKSVVLFGSFARGDWHRGSDIDIFIYGDKNGLDKSKYELKLKRQIEVHLLRQRRKSGR